MKQEKTKKAMAEILTLAIICAIILTTGIVTAMYPGETKTFPNNMGIDNLVYTIIGNTTPVFPIIIINSTNITVTFPGDMAPNNFSIVFLEKETERIVQTIYTGGGGSSRTVYKNKNITKNIPIYTDKVEEVEKLVEVPTETIIEIETGYEWWDILLVFVLTVIVSVIVINYKLRKKNELD